MPINSVAAVDHEMNEGIYIHHPEYFLYYLTSKQGQWSSVLSCIS
jgi:hypothetical protein